MSRHLSKKDFGPANALIRGQQPTTFE